MDETQSNGPIQDIETDEPAVRKTWPRGMPALRLGRRGAAQTQQAARPSAAATGAQTGVALDAPPPRFLRLARLFAGLVLLGIAWLGVVAVVMLVQHVGLSFTRQHILTQVLFNLAFLAVIGLINLTVLGCLIVGAFCLFLALTARGWR